MQQDSEFQEEFSHQSFEQAYNNKIRKSSQELLKNYHQGSWSENQKMRYVAFLSYNKKYLTSKTMRRNMKIFKQMSQFIGTRSSTQCRSQNQKIYRKYKTIVKIIQAFKLELGTQRFENLFAQLCKEPTIKFKIQNQQIKDQSDQQKSASPRQNRQKIILTEASMQTDEIEPTWQTTQSILNKFMGNQGLNSIENNSWEAMKRYYELGYKDCYEMMMKGRERWAFEGKEQQIFNSGLHMNE